MFEEEWDVTSVTSFCFFFFFFGAGCINLMSLIVTGLKGRDFCDVFFCVCFCLFVFVTQVFHDRDGSQGT